jgi:ActR/RegA family two-component response regulator
VRGVQKKVIQTYRKAPQAAEKLILQFLPDEIADRVRGREEKDPVMTEQSIQPPEVPDTPEAQEFVRLLVEEGGNVSAVARRLSKHVTQLRRDLAKYGIDPDRYRPK